MVTPNRALNVALSVAGRFMMRPRTELTMPRCAARQAYAGSALAPSAVQPGGRALPAWGCGSSLPRTM